ncbi:hypothetical protein SDC9_72272 [bioreactor metagenome]|uniref:Uncharacterized protein n=1 Tax=bioreactor metagenome TaxID=1076179 RepID=A0A644YAX6_9ZZZZ
MKNTKILTLILIALIISCFLGKSLFLYTFMSLVTLLILPEIIINSTIQNSRKLIYTILLILICIIAINLFFTKNQLYTYLVIAGTSAIVSTLTKYVKDKKNEEQTK